MEKFRPKKRYGQNFLQDQTVLQKIIDAAQLTKDDTVLEIGMGTGILTERLAPLAGKVIGIEIDKELFPNTQQKLEKFMNVNFIMGDFLDNADNIFKNITGKVKVVANIPYYITTPILEKLLVYRNKVSEIILMVQKEVAMRLVASPGGKDFGSLTLFISYYADTELVCNVPATAFYPVPKVESAVIKIKLLPKPRYVVNNEKRLFNIIRAAFWGRRKTLNNCLRKAPQTHYTNEMITKIGTETGIDFGLRGERLSLAQYVAMANVQF